MKLDKLRALRNELNNEFGQNSIESAIYYYFEEKWYLLDGSGELDQATKTCLQRAENNQPAYHTPRSKSAWFACPSMNCTISLTFPNSPRVRTQEQTRGRIEQVVIRASNAYQVAHHPLTQLLAREAFRNRLQMEIDDLNATASPSPDTQDVDRQQLLAVFAIDIDHFKQVNDSHGHIYGDQVLKAFGMRLERAAREWSQIDRSAMTIEIGHPSGEEFLMFVTGSIDKGDLVDFGNFVRNKIDGEPLPTEAEWELLSQEENLSMLVPPTIHERAVTTSIGLAIYARSSANDNVEEITSQLLENADTALYRAKAAGRNQIIAYDDILTHCGRVLEQDSGTRIVAVDIGKNVGVTVGQEFLVFPPGFTGQKKFQISDGRSTRTIGTYPRFNHTRITVFDVQPELSFAFISESEEHGVSIEEGSHLEAIPLGSIGHLLPHASKYLASSMDGVQIGDIDVAQTFISENCDAEPQPFAVVFRFARANQYLKAYGPAALNAALARLFRGATSTFHAAADLSVLDSASVLMVGRGVAYSEEQVTEFVERFAAELPELSLMSGVFCADDASADPDEGESKLGSDHAIEFARFAASDHALTSESRVTHFSHKTASRILLAQREASSYSQASTDFEKFRTLGVESASIYNTGGLIYSALRRREQSAEYFLRAANLKDSIIFRSNLATTAETRVQRENALRLLAAEDDSAISDLGDYHPYGLLSYAKLMAVANLESSDWFDADRFAWLAPAALALPEPEVPDIRELLENILGIED